MPLLWIVRLCRGAMALVRFSWDYFLFLNSKPLSMNKLFFGDNLEILQRLYSQSKEGFIDLIYIDPPFNSKRNYNVLFEDIDLVDTKAQKEAFADTWSNVSYIDTLNELKSLNLDLYTVLETFDNVKISKSAVAYLTTMAVRVWYMHKLLKDTGSFYLHCDATMSHYLKIVCDLIFGESNFKNEISWKRSNAHNDSVKRFGKITDTILFYTKTKNSTFNIQYTPYSQHYIDSEWNLLPSGRYYKAENMLDPQKKMKEVDFHGTRARWRYTPEKMEEMWNKPQTEVPNSHGRIKLGKDGKPIKRCRIIFLDELDGVPLQDMWDDIPYLVGTSEEHLGYPTQKPLTLLERIVKVSSNENDLVADFFCGCGTTIAAAEKLKRKWLGVDISHLAINLISKRLIDTYGVKIRKTFEIDGMPKDLDSAKKLATDEGGRFRFQDWIVEVMMHGVANEKKSADGGWDGYITFEYTEGAKILKDIVLIEVKSGNVNVKNVREFIQVVEKRKSGIGVFVCFEEQVTKPMLLEAKQQGYFRGDLSSSYPKIQIITVEDLLNGKMVEMPKSSMGTFKTSKRQKSKDGEQSAISF
jgi:DNA modification methylase